MSNLAPKVITVNAEKVFLGFKLHHYPNRGSGFFGGEYGYGVEYENEIFLMRPDYQDAECECGFDKLAEAWHKANPHTVECYISVRRQRIEQWENLNPKPEFDSERRWYDKRTEVEESISQELCLKMGISWNDGHGSAIHCTCGKEEIARAWFAENDHMPRCPIALPNFWFKPTDFRISWYKYIGRDNVMNKTITAGEWSQILGDILASIGGPTIDAAIEAYEISEANNSGIDL